MTIIIPVFHRYPEEGAIVGRIVLGYSELELMLAYVTAIANETEQDDILRAVYRAKSESARRLVCDALLKTPMKKLNLDGLRTEVKGCIKWCNLVRNQYAHCQWADTSKGVFFSNLDESAGKDDGFIQDFKHIDLALLKSQEGYFVHTRTLFLYIEHEIQVRKGALKSNPWSKPKAPMQPTLCNPHVKYP